MIQALTASAANCVQVRELSCSRYHQFNQQEWKYFQYVSRDISALNFPRFVSTKTSGCRCEQVSASSPSTPEARLCSKAQL